jgi:tetratricopeptide (TPR) repeat protein
MPQGIPVNPVEKSVFGLKAFERLPIIPIMIDSPSQMTFLAAEGYLELGMLDDAMQEYERLSARTKQSVEGLTLLVEIHRAAGNAEELEFVAEQLCIIDPDNVDRWIELALALRSIKIARELLLKVAERFPDTALVHFHLARFECSLGNLALAKEHLGRSKKLCPVCRVLALTDEADLLPIWSDHSTPQLTF